MAFPLKSRRSRVAAVVAVLVLWYAAAYPRGVLMAHIDHARGRYEVQTYGLPAPWTPQLYDLLRERYGTRLNMVAGCCVCPVTEWYAAGYNSASRRLLEEKFGKDIFEECDVLARQRWEAEHPEQ